MSGDVTHIRRRNTGENMGNMTEETDKKGGVEIGTEAGVRERSTETDMRIDTDIGKEIGTGTDAEKILILCVCY